MLLAATVLAASSLTVSAQPAPPRGTSPAVQPPAAAQPTAPGNLDRLRGMQATSTALDLETVPQTGRKADQLRANLANIQMPPGFSVDLYALVPDARHMAVGTNAGVVYVGTRKTKIWAVTDRTRARARVADEVKVFAPSIAFRQPNGLCFSKDGQLYVTEHNRVLVFPAAEFFYEGPDVAVDVVAEQLVPKSEESFNHGARTCTIGPDNKLYVTLGQPFNVPPPAKAALYAKEGIGGIIRMDRDGKNREVFARGIRNSVGQDWNPKTGELWFTDNQVDGMGDDTPPGELNHITKIGQNFGFPYYGGGHTRTVEYKDAQAPADVTFPDVEMAAHAADLGMHLYHGKMFPEEYRGAIFSAQHGSWNRTSPVGARVMVTTFKPDGAVDKSEPFAQGWLNDETGEYSGRPVDVAELADGSMLVSDAFAGAIYRISYKAR